MSSPARRSSRRKKAVRYSVDPLKASGVDLGSDVEEQGGTARNDAVESDASEYGEEGERSGEDDGDEDAVPSDKDNGDTVSVRSASLEETQPARQKGVKRKQAIPMQRAREARNDMNEQGTRSRGLGKDALGAHAKSSHIRLCFGPTSDLLPILIARELWMGHMDVTFPSKKTLRKALKEPREEYVPCVYPEQYKAEATSGWDWYYGEPGERFRGKQKQRAVPKEEGRSYLPSPRQEPLKVLVGPIGPQKVYETNVGDIFNFGEAFAKGTREGWILDAGNKVQCLSWCPNVVGDNQYLAVAAPVRDEQKRAQEESHNEAPPSAFERTGPFPGAIQIWAFKAERKEGEGLAGLDVAVKPRLVQVICTDAGNVRRLAWCPSPREWREVDRGEGERTSLGLLGGVWSDGTVKVLDVKVRKDAEDTEYVVTESPAFEARLSNTLCTCFSWLSPRDLVTGHANGSIGVWDLISPHEPPTPTASPFLHKTYIVELEACYPTKPDLVATVAMDGQLQLTSLLDPAADVAAPQRSRLISPCLAYLPILQSFVSTDDVDLLRVLPFRRFISPITIARAYCPVSAYSPGSTHHPIILYANTGGTVFATNPFSRMLHQKGKHFQQAWFNHEWTAGPYPDGNSKHAGAVRFIDGYKAEAPSLMQRGTPDKQQTARHTNVTIFEEKTAVTAVAWNPSGECAGWAAAGMGSGLVRVEDLSI